MPSPEPQEAIHGSDIEQLEDFAVEALSFSLEHRSPMIRKKTNLLCSLLLLCTAACFQASQVP